ncbi:MAG TPA: HIT family protein [Phycisphaerae bacterium]|nr:HIT family protein [Phycisphaerae bacterium]
MKEANCIFCKIASGEIPSSKVFENDRVLAFLDSGPLSPGHTLLIPKDHFRDLRDISGEALGAVLAVAPRIADAVMKTTGATGLNFLQNTGATSGQAVFHVHFHLIPRGEADGLGYRWNAGKYAESELETYRARIAKALGSST